jgi:flagellar hook-basal body complex protein FliE
MSVAPIAPPTIAPITGTESTPKIAGATGGEDFGKTFADARALETDATKAAEAFAKGDPSVGIHEVMIASEKANIALKFATTMKNKAIEAYRELMNTQV